MWWKGRSSTLLLAPRTYVFAHAAAAAVRAALAAAGKVVVAQREAAKLMKKMTVRGFCSLGACRCTLG